MTAHPALVLNADFRPVSYFPVSLLSWQDAVTAVLRQRVAVVAEYDTWVRSPSTRMRLPSVVALRKYQRPPRRVAFTRFNVFLRDRFTCQYCGVVFPAFGADVRARGSALARRPDNVGEHRHRLHAVQPGQGGLAARQAALRAQGADGDGVDGCQASVSSRLSA
jgi:hypothetical protein